METENFEMVNLATLEDATKLLQEVKQQVLQLKAENTELRLYIEKVFGVLSNINMTADIVVKAMLKK